MNSPETSSGLSPSHFSRCLMLVNLSLALCMGARFVSRCISMAHKSSKFIKFKVHLSDSPHVGIRNTTAKREQRAYSAEIVQQYNIMSTQVVSGAVTSGGTEIPESSSKLRHIGLRMRSDSHVYLHVFYMLSECKCAVKL